MVTVRSVDGLHELSVPVTAERLVKYIATPDSVLVRGGRYDGTIIVRTGDGAAMGDVIFRAAEVNHISVAELLPAGKTYKRYRLSISGLENTFAETVMLKLVEEGGQGLRITFSRSFQGSSVSGAMKNEFS